MGFKLYFPDGPTDAERIADAQERIADVLAQIKGSLERVDDPHVWGGYPDGWRPGDEDDEDDPRVPVGLFLNLERCTRGDPTWQMAMAIDIAFALGKRAANGDVDFADLQRRIEACRRGALNAAAVKSGEWKAVAHEMLDADKGRTTDEKITDKIDAELEKRRLKRARRTIFNEVRAWRHPAP